MSGAHAVVALSCSELRSARMLAPTRRPLYAMQLMRLLVLQHGPRLRQLCCLANYSVNM